MSWSFDLLHPGHIYHFDQAKAKSDILVVSITSDNKVLKGPGKPYFNEKHRLYALASLEVVDYVVISNEKSAVNVIKKLKPNIYVKGNDYKNSEDDITGKIFDEKKSEKYGGQILFTSGPVFSSSKIINKEFFTIKNKTILLKN